MVTGTGKGTNELRVVFFLVGRLGDNSEVPGCSTK